MDGGGRCTCYAQAGVLLTVVSLMLNAFAATELARHPCQHTRCRAHAGYWTLTQAGLAWCCLLYTCLLQSGAVSTGMQAVVHDGDSASLGASSTTVKTTHVSLASGGNVHVAREARQRRGGSLRSKPSVEGGRRRTRQVNQTILVRTPPAPLREVLVETNRVTRRRERKLRSLAPVTQVQRKRRLPLLGLLRSHAWETGPCRMQGARTKGKVFLASTCLAKKEKETHWSHRVSKASLGTAKGPRP